MGGQQSATFSAGSVKKRRVCDAHLSDCAHGLGFLLVDLATGEGPCRALVPPFDEQDLRPISIFQSVPAVSEPPRDITVLKEQRRLTLSHHSLIKTAPQTGTRSLYCMNEVHIRACWGTRSCKRGHDLNMRSEKALRL